MASRYECDQCGACCRSRLVVLLTDLDVAREPRLRAAAGRSNILCPAKGLDPSCPMLGADNGCTVYQTRPAVCAAMPAGEDQCQWARKTAGLPPLMPVEGLA